MQGANEIKIRCICDRKPFVCLGIRQERGCKWEDVNCWFMGRNQGSGKFEIKDMEKIRTRNNMWQDPRQLITMVKQRKAVQTLKKWKSLSSFVNGSRRVNLTNKVTICHRRCNLLAAKLSVSRHSYNNVVWHSHNIFTSLFEDSVKCDRYTVDTGKRHLLPAHFVKLKSIYK